MQSMSLFLDITKLADFQQKNAYVIRTPGVCYAVYLFSGSSLGMVQVCQVSSL